MEDDDELYPQCFPPNITKENGFRDLVNQATIDCEEYEQLQLFQCHVLATTNNWILLFLLLKSNYHVTSS